MANKEKNILEVFVEAMGIYTKHFPAFIKYMSFPILGQIVGIILSFALSLGFAYTVAPNLPNPNTAYMITLALAIPGLIIFVKAFWGYLVSYVAVSSMAENTVKSGRIYDIPAHTKVATNSKRIGDFVTLWIAYGLVTFIAILPPFWFFFPLIVLVFQVFTFEKNLNVAECFRRSFAIVKENYIKTFCLLIFVAFVTYYLLPKLVEMLFDFVHLTPILISLIDPYFATTLPYEQINSAFSMIGSSYVLSSLFIAKTVISATISTLVICYTLPLRTICWTLWYKELSIKEAKANSKKKKAKSENV